MENLTNRYNTVEKWLHYLKWKPCVVGVIIGCFCTSVLGLSIGLIAHPYLTSLSSGRTHCSNCIDWESCSSRCGNNTQIGIKQNRQTVDDLCRTTSNITDQNPCSSQRNGPVDGGWSSWEKFGSCNAKCGKGVIPIVRRCDRPAPINGGKYCIGKSYGLGTCLYEACQATNKNIALHKKTRQSSLYIREGDLSVMYSSNAVDGKTIQYDHDLCTHTRKTLRAWWAVDLGDVFEIQRVVLYGRTDCCTERLSNFDIDAFMPIPKKETTLYNFQQGTLARCHYQADKVSNQGLNTSCAHGTYGQFLRVRLRGFDFLTLCEVEVYATDKSQHLKIDNNFVYSEPYIGPDIRELKGVSSETCSNFCQSGAVQDCSTSFLSDHNVCIATGTNLKP